MKTLILITTLLFTFTSHAGWKCWLIPEKDQDGNYIVKPMKGGAPGNPICRVDCEKSKQGQDYKIEIVTRNPQGDISSRKPWSESASLEPDEEILCSIDQTKRQNRLDQREQARKARQDRQEKRRQINEWLREECAKKIGQHWNNDRAKYFKCEATQLKMQHGLMDSLDKRNYQVGAP